MPEPAPASSPSAADDPRAAAAAWPWWFGPVGFVAALMLTVVVGGLVGAAVRSAGGPGHRADHVASLLATLIQDAALVLVAVAFAATVGRVAAASFGLRPARLVPAAGLVALTLVGFYAVSAAWTVLVDPQAEQDTLAALGADETPALLVASAILVVAVAPLAEELFFRGFFYRALRNRLSVPAAVTAVSLLFGAIHYTGPRTLALLPMLALLSALFCLLYERTGSLWPAVALHTVNNAVAFAATTQTPGAALVAGTIGALMLGACALVPARLQAPG